MTLTLPFVAVLAVVGWLVVRHTRLRWWAVTALLLLGFYLASTPAAPLIDDTTRSGVEVVNRTGSK
ncbi:hypothetical protein GCM10009759_39460 [Kitasatospora saccharophila]|uniref:Uncharacterized protein n=1 Tax=Kitasatospora saccharophila TaxID=407973 RepID=A0ABN2X4Q6_9ACTN